VGHREPLVAHPELRQPLTASSKVVVFRVPPQAVMVAVARHTVPVPAPVPVPVQVLVPVLFQQVRGVAQSPCILAQTDWLDPVIITIA
jgi:hypothetical protein